MHKRFILINCPGLGVGDVRNSSGSEHCIEKLLRSAHENQLQLDMSGLESIGFNAFVKYQGSQSRKSSVTARLAARNVYGNEDFDAFCELGGGDTSHDPIFSRMSPANSDGQPEVFLISIGYDESIVPAHEFISVDADDQAFDQLRDILEAPLVRNECIIVSLNNYREAALDSNPTFAAASLAYLSRIVKETLGKLGADDGLMVLSTTAIDSTSSLREFRNELTPMMYHTPMGQIHDLGLRLLADVGPSIAEFFGLDRSQMIGASMGKWMASAELSDENPQEVTQSPLHS